MKMASKNTIQVYRVENEEGVGPYAGNACEDMRYYHNSVACYRSHPSPFNDGLGSPWEKNECLWNRDMVFGFPSLARLYTWFDGFITDLHNAGYHIAVYQCRKGRYAMSKKQVVFYKDEHLRNLALYREG